MQHGATVAKFQIPGEDDRDGKTGDDEDGDKSGRPRWQVELTENNVGDLDEQPTK